jgi:hypothetical protein
VSDATKREARVAILGGLILVGLFLEAYFGLALLAGLA